MVARPRRRRGGMLGGRKIRRRCRAVARKWLARRVGLVVNVQSFRTGCPLAGGKRALR